MGFNRHMMALARDSRGLTQVDLAESMGVAQASISKHEAGLVEPSDGFVASLSRELRYRPAFFSEPGQPYGMPPFHFRRRKKLPAKALAKIVAEMNVRRMHVAKLLRSYSAWRNASIPEVDRDEYIGRSRKPFSIEAVALHLRDQWNLGRGPIPNMIGLLEEVGGIVVPCDFGTELLDATSQRVDGLPPLFFINVNAPADRMRYTLAHELGHVVLHTTSVIDDDAMEEEADEFAGTFLLPTSEVRPQLRRFDIRQAANMKRVWGVSMQAIAVRAERLGVITPYQSRKFFIQMGQHGWRKREPHEPAKESPTLLRDMVRFHTKRLRYTLDDVAELLGIDEPEVRTLYGDVQASSPTLRVVK